MFDLPDFDDHEAVHAFHDPDAGLRYIVAIHDTTLGPAIGGCRMWPYASAADALRDALRLSRGMTYKAALAGVPWGGGKSVVLGDPHSGAKSPALLQAIGRAVDSLGGRYTTSDDVGITARDVAEIAKTTPHACAPLMENGQAAPATAYGTYQGILAATMHAFGSEQLAGRSVAVQGLGAVGMQLCEYLAQDGACLRVADIDPVRVAEACHRWNAEAATPDAVLESEVDILAPCALGGVLNEHTVPRLRCRIVAGAANNQLATPADGDRLHRRGIVYAPDYAINVGGLIDLVHALRGVYDVEAVLDDCRGILDRTRWILAQAAERDLPSTSIADDLARSRFERTA
jgi:leucine dehydrogenase